MANGGDLSIAIGIQDLTRTGIARVLQQLKKVPGGMTIAVDATSDLSAIRNARNEMNKAAEVAAKLNSVLNEKVGEQWLSGAIADAKRYEANIRNLDKSLSKLGSSKNKTSVNGILSNFGRLDQKGQGEWIERIAERSRNLQAELNKLRSQGDTISPANTQAVKTHEREVANLTSRLQQYMALQQKMQSINARQARIIASNQQRLNASDLLVQGTKKSSSIRGLLDGYDKKTLLERQAVMADLLKRQQKLQTDLNLKNASRKTVDPSDTQAVKAHEAAVKALIAQLKQLGQLRKSAERMDKQIAREEKSLYNKIQQSERSKASAIARNQGIYDSASFKEYMRNFKTFTQEGQRTALRGYINERINVAGNLEAETNRLQGINPANTQAIAAQEQKVAQLRAQYSALTNQILQMRRAMDATDKNTARGVEILGKSFERINASMSKGRLNNLLSQFKGLDASNQLKIFDKITRKVNEVQQKLANLSAKGKTINPNDTQAVRAHEREVARLTQQLNSLTSAQSRMRNTMNAQQARSAAQALRDARQSAAQYRAELNGVQVAMRSTSQFASQLREDIQQAFGYYALKQFLSNLIEIGGQFEYQRRAIANILQDGTKANMLFNQIKDLGVQSPFSTLDLDKYAKQLSAFDIPYHRMFDTLKKLADISAGTGADMSRIILAYGHVKSEGFLTGVQRRQFSNANINIVGGLSDYYTKQEGQQVTKRDVYKRIHDKQVSFEDMETVLLGMAEEGGQFHNMQEVMASTVKGVYKNLSDAINHMYMSIEKSANGPLMFFGKTLTHIINLVERFPGSASRFVTAAVAMSSIRALSASMANKEAAATVKRITLYDQEIAASNRMAVATAKEAAAMKAKNKAIATTVIGGSSSFGGQALTVASAQNIANTIKLGNAEGIAMKQAVLHGIARRQLNKELAQYLVEVKAITAAEARAALTSRTFWGTIRMGATAAMASIKSLFLSMGPMLALWGAFEGVMWIYNKIVDTKGEERKKAMVDALRDSYSSLKREMEQLPESFDHMYSGELFESIKDMTNTVKDNLADSEMILGRVFAKDANGEYLHNTLQQAIALRGEMERALGIKEDMYKKDIISQFIPNDTKGGPLIWRDWKDFPSFWKHVDKLRQDYELSLSAAVNNKDFLNAAGIARNANEEYKDLSDYDLAKKIIPTSGDWASYYKGRYKDYTEGLEKFDTYLNGIGKAWIGLAKSHGYEKDEDILSVLSAAVGAQTELDDRGKKYVMDYFTKTFYPALYKGASDGNVTVPSAIYDAIMEKLDVLKNIEDPLEKSRFRSFKIQRTSTLAEMYDAFVSDYKDLTEKFKETYKETALLKGIITDSDIKNPKKKEISGQYGDKVKQALEQWNQDVERRNSLIAAAAEAGYDLTTLKKGAQSGGGNKDEWLDKFKTRYDLLKKASQEFKKQIDAGIGEQKAFDYLLNIADYREALKGVDKGSLGDLSKAVNQIIEENRKELNLTEQRKRVLNQMIHDASGLQLDELIKVLKLKIDSAKEEMDKAQLQYTAYTKMYEATGNHDIAGKFAFGNNAPRKRMMYDEFIKSQFNKAAEKLGFDVSYNDVSLWGEKEWLGEGAALKPIYEQSRKALEQWTKQMQESYITLLNIDKSYEEEKRNINAKYDEEQQRNNIMLRQGTPQPLYQIATSKTSARRALDLTALDLKYSGVLENPSEVARKEAMLYITARQTALNKALKAGAIDAETYGKEIEKISNAFEKFKGQNVLGFNDRITALLDRGLPGYLERIKKDFLLTQQYPNQFKDPNGKIRRRYERWFGNGEKEGWIETQKKIDDLISAFRRSSNTSTNIGRITSGAMYLSGRNTSKLDSVLNFTAGITDGLATTISGLENMSLENTAAGMMKMVQASKAYNNDKDASVKSIYSRETQYLQNEMNAIERSKARSFGGALEYDKKKLEELKKQEQELESHYNWSKNRDKDNNDPVYTEQVRGQWKAVQDEIKYFWADTFQQNFGVDFKDYSQRLTDALVNAFKKGEDAAIAWKKTVGDIVRELANQVVRTKIIEPMFDNVFDYFFGEGGAFVDKKEFTDDDVKLIGDKLMEMNFESAIDKVGVLYKAIEDRFPLSSESESTGGLTRLGSQLTEETGSVMTGYINSIRVDVSENRKALSLLTEQLLPRAVKSNALAQSQLTQLETIAQHTGYTLLEASEIRRLLNSVINGTDKINI